ncbi:MAG: N-formylglutamate amidohydrolase [Gaiella sp.]
MATGVFLVTCEHGGNRIPAAYRHLFGAQRALLATHRGHDAGALVMARSMSRALGAPLVWSTTSRLLVDLNRSIGQPRLFSAATRAAPRQLRSEIVEQHYRPYRAEVERRVRHAVARGRRVIHISSHSFTPVLDGAVRRADVGLLYDPGRPHEVALCARWKSALSSLDRDLRVRRNYPYAGKGDGLAAYLRKQFDGNAYVGVELEVNQALVAGAPRAWSRLRARLIASLRTALAAIGETG